MLVLHGAFSYALLHSELAIALSSYYTVHVASRPGRGLSEPYPPSVTELNPRHQPPAATESTVASESNKGSESTKGPRDPRATIYQDDVVKLGPNTYTRTYNPALTTAVIAAEVSAIETLIEATGAIYIIGVSSGALLTLQGLLQDPRSFTLSKIRKVIIFEPPIFFTDRPTTCALEKLSQFERELEDGDIVGAAATAMHMVQLGPAWIPRWLMKALSGIMFRTQDKAVQRNKAKGGDDRGVCTMSGLTRLLRYDFSIVEGMAAESGRYKVLSWPGDAASEQKVQILLLSGGQSPSFLTEGMNTLRDTNAGAKSVVVEGVGHELLCDREMRGQPARAVPTIREFFHW